MPITYSEKHICEKCGKEFEWMHFDFIRNRMTDRQYTAEVIPNILQAYYFHLNDNGSYDVKINCPHCEWDNHFSVSQIITNTTNNAFFGSTF